MQIFRYRAFQGFIAHKMLLRGSGASILKLVFSALLLVDDDEEVLCVDVH